MFRECRGLRSVGVARGSLHSYAGPRLASTNIIDSDPKTFLTYKTIFTQSNKKPTLNPKQWVSKNSVPLQKKHKSNDFIFLTSKKF